MNVTSPVEELLAAFLAAVGIANVVLLHVLDEVILGGLTLGLLVVGLLALALWLLSPWGTDTVRTDAASVLLVLGAVSELLVTSMGVQAIPQVGPKLLWGAGLGLVLYVVFEDGRGSRAQSAS